MGKQIHFVVDRVGKREVNEILQKKVRDPKMLPIIKEMLVILSGCCGKILHYSFNLAP